MELGLLRVFQRIALEHSEYVLEAMARIRADPQRAEVWADIQTVVLAAGNLSKLMWGGGGKKAAARAPLRDSIGVPDASPLELPDMRNNFEHFDDRLDTWWEQSTNHNIFDRQVLPRNMIEGAAETDRFREYDPTTGYLWFWGDQLNLFEIEAEVQRIHPRLKSEANKPHWDPAIDG